MMQGCQVTCHQDNHYQGGEEQGAGAGLGWGGGASDAAQASLLTHLPHCSFLASQGPVEELAASHGAEERTHADS